MNLYSPHRYLLHKWITNWNSRTIRKTNRDNTPKQTADLCFRSVSVAMQILHLHLHSLSVRFPFTLKFGTRLCSISQKLYGPVGLIKSKVPAPPPPSLFSGDRYFSSRSHSVRLETYFEADRCIFWGVKSQFYKKFQEIPQT